jgi:hypothetical protein
VNRTASEMRVASLAGPLFFQALKEEDIKPMLLSVVILVVG